ncbi:MAG TPA: ABC transporter ATP-binding protein [Tepidisphaeraceae bacterium]
MAHDPAIEEDVYVGKLNLALWRKVVSFALPLRKYVAVLVGLGVFVSALDVALPWFTGRIVDAVTTTGDASAFAALRWKYLLTMFIFSCSIFGFILAAGKIVTGVSFDIRETAFEKLQELPFSFYDRKAVGWLMARLTSDCSTLSQVMAWALLDVIWGVTVTISVGIMMLRLNWRLGILVLLVTPVLIYVARFFQVRLLITSRLLRKANSQTTAAFNEGIVGVRTSKSMVREERNLQEFRELSGAMYGHALRNAIYNAMFFPLMLSICSVGAAMALYKGGLFVQRGEMSLGRLVTFLQYAGFVIWPIQELCNAITRIQGAQASAERIVGLLDTEVEIRDSEEVLARLRNGNGSVDMAPDGLPAKIESVEFKNVTFAYKAGQTVLRNFNLTVEAGQTIALVGPTGGGKTTIVGLACRFYEPTSGEVLINGVDYRKRSLKWLQSQLGMVLQQPHLFSGTIRQNIRYGRLSATDAEIEEAARRVNAHDFIMGLKDGYEATVGEGGNQLSTGQKQLIALARAVIADPQIFVMDEATSSVDTQTERAIQEAIERVLANRISFVIAHRLSTIRNADRILVIESGQIAEQGTHAELIRRRGHYFELYTSQFTHEREEQMLDYKELTAVDG